jgi:hypothetical protein
MQFDQMVETIYAFGAASSEGRPKVRSAINTLGAEWDNYDNG